MLTFNNRTALVTGAGPIGMLAALLAVQRGYQVHVFDRVTDGPKPGLVAALGATYHRGSIRDAGPPPDVVLECTGAGELVVEVADRMVGMVSASMVLANSVVFGTVSAARRHYEQATRALAGADPAWLGALISRRVPLSSWQHVLIRGPGDVKVAVDLTK